MARSAFDKDSDDGGARSAAPQDGRMACTFCGAPTLPTMLSQYGARCFPCFEAYCAKGMSGAAPGFTNHGRDTETQRAMRKALKGSRPVGQKMEADLPDVDVEARAAAKAAAARKVARYQAEHPEGY